MWDGVGKSATLEKPQKPEQWPKSRVNNEAGKKVKVKYWWIDRGKTRVIECWVSVSTETDIIISIVMGGRGWC